MITTPYPPPPFSLTERLTGHSFFDTLSASEVAEIAGQAIQRKFAAGEILYLEGDPSAGMWMVEQGGAKVFKVNTEGVEHILHLIGPGDSFNEIPALDGGPNPANAAALSDLTCWVLPSNVVIHALNAYPGLAIAMVGKLAARVRMLVQRIEDLALYPVSARLARFLLQQANFPSSEKVGITRAAIASYLATTPETVSRMLRSFEEAGAIRFDRHRIVVVDKAVLRGIALL